MDLRHFIGIGMLAVSVATHAQYSVWIEFEEDPILAKCVEAGQHAVFNSYPKGHVMRKHVTTEYPGAVKGWQSHFGTDTNAQNAWMKKHEMNGAKIGRGAYPYLHKMLHMTVSEGPKGTLADIKNSILKVARLAKTEGWDRTVPMQELKGMDKAESLKKAGVFKGRGWRHRNAGGVHAPSFLTRLDKALASPDNQVGHAKFIPYLKDNGAKNPKTGHMSVWYGFDGRKKENLNLSLQTFARCIQPHGLAKLHARWIVLADVKKRRRDLGWAGKRLPSAKRDMKDILDDDKLVPPGFSTSEWERLQIVDVLTEKAVSFAEFEKERERTGKNMRIEL